MSIRTPRSFPQEIISRECLINGIRQPYDVCSSGNLEGGKMSYGDKYEYIGSGKTYWVNGVKNVSSQDNHYFIRKEHEEKSPADKQG